LFGALHRVHIALCDYGTKGQQKWYMGLLLEAPGNVYLYAGIAEGAQASARGSDLHFGGVRQFWKTFEEAAQNHGITLPAEVTNIKGAYLGAIDLLKQPESLVPQLPPMN
jgi:hypothetical protein